MPLNKETKPRLDMHAYIKAKIYNNNIHLDHIHSRKKGVLRIALNYIWWWGTNSGDLWRVQYRFTAITPRSTLTPSGSAC